jgi:hypothetical protein
MMLNNLGFAVEMEVAFNGESFQVNGDDKRLVVSFASLSTVRRILQLIRNKSFESSFPAKRVVSETDIEVRLSGRTIALSGRTIKSGMIARLLGLQGTRLFIVNLMQSMILSSSQRREGASGVELTDEPR